MAADINRIIKAFVLAKSVNHYYWLHAPAEDQNVRIENLARVVAMMSGLRIEKRLVPTGGGIIRGLTERYPDRAVILVRKEQPLVWQRYTTIKELCHIVYDGDGDFEPDPTKTLEQLVMRRSLDLDEEGSPALMSERLAEIMALELAYPLEFRRVDVAAIRNGSTVDDLVALRDVPAVHIERALGEQYIEACEGVWQSLAEVPIKPLPDKA